MKLQFTDDLKPLIENYTALEVPVDRKTAAEVTKAAEKLGTIQKRRWGRLHSFLKLHLISYTNPKKKGQPSPWRLAMQDPASTIPWFRK
jgi:hypothetical protein